ncbi:MAG TPA: hypothetical protein VGL40_15040 [Bacillota bacterium]|jgi:hypothetical protein
MRKALLVAAVLVLIVSALAGQAFWSNSTVSEQGGPPSAFVSVSSLRLDLSIPQYVSYADAIVRGRVTGIGPGSWNTPDGHKPSSPDPLAAISAPVHLKVTAVLKGNVGVGNDLTFAQMGGTADGVTQVFADEPTFNVGEDVIVFLRPSAKKVGLIDISGKFVIGQDGSARNSVTNSVFRMEDLVKQVQAATK